MRGRVSEGRQAVIAVSESDRLPPGDAAGERASSLASAANASSAPSSSAPSSLSESMPPESDRLPAAPPPGDATGERAPSLGSAAVNASSAPSLSESSAPSLSESSPSESSNAPSAPWLSESSALSLSESSAPSLSQCHALDSDSDCSSATSPVCGGCESASTLFGGRRRHSRYPPPSDALTVTQARRRSGQKYTDTTTHPRARWARAPASSC